VNRPAADRRTRWIAYLGVGLVRLLGLTWRVRYRDDEQMRQARRDKRPVVYMLWHGQLLPLLWAHRNRGISILISEHRDGEIIARIAHALGYRTVRGSTSRGASRALIGMAREIEAGFDVAITPDGPRGPAHSFASGALHVAQRTGCPLLPVAAASRAWRLNSWDRFAVPLPFARITVAYTPFVTIPKGNSRAIEARVSECAAAIDAATAKAHT
jgi:lysophospholipid acyltransferase (LPLAT)-like uncharacterized protein